jgi:hypothetical protein
MFWLIDSSDEKNGHRFNEQSEFYTATSALIAGQGS